MLRSDAISCSLWPGPSFSLAMHDVWGEKVAPAAFQLPTSMKPNVRAC